MTDDTSLPAAKECWGLYDASGALSGVRPHRDDLILVRNMHRIEGNDVTGWTIRRVRVEPMDDAKIAEKEAG